MSESSILVVDDNQMVREVLRRSLSSLGYSVRAVEDGRTAIEEIQKNPTCFSVVLLDVRMPDLDGIQTIGRIRDIRPDLPIIYLTGFADVPEDVLIASGANAVVEKPFDIELLSELVREYSEPATRPRRRQLLSMMRDALVTEWQSKPKYKGMTPPRDVGLLVDGIIEAEECPEE